MMSEKKLNFRVRYGVTRLSTLIYIIIFVIINFLNVYLCDYVIPTPDFYEVLANETNYCNIDNNPYNYAICSSRNGGQIQYIVLSLTGNTNINETFTFYQTPYSNKSVHYVIQNYPASLFINISDNGQIYKIVDPTNVAFQYPEIDQYIISINHVGILNNGSIIGGYTADMYKQSAILVASLCQDYNIPVDRYHIIDSSEISTIGGINDGGVGNTWDWDYYIDIINYYYGRVCAFPYQSQGNTGYTVNILQQFLASLLYNVTVNSVYDFQTEMAVAALQAANKITPTGYMDDDTWTALVSLISGLPIENQVVEQILNQRFFNSDNNLTASLIALQINICDMSASPLLTTETWKCIIAGCTEDVTKPEIDSLTGFFASLSILLLIWLIIVIVLYVKLRRSVDASDPSKNYAKI